MHIIHSIDEMQCLGEKLRRGGSKIGFVPTMGYLHEGHLSLVNLLKEQTDTVILSIFVNPIQFGKGEDLEKYPRDLDGDMKLCQERGVDIVFIPEGGEMYRKGHSTLIQEEKVSEGLCGKTRPSHFQGVTTICAKLFNICQPHSVALGQKDAQQVVVLKRMILDLNFPIEVVVGDILRENDGLAMSSRNSYLTSEQRSDALFINRSLRAGQELVGQGVLNSDSITQAVLSTLRQAESIQLDYVEVVDRDTMEPKQEIIPNQSMIVLAVWIDKVRLIDNLIL
jgi:pantoate--beta-alanine ligase